MILSILNPAVLRAEALTEQVKNLQGFIQAHESKLEKLQVEIRKAHLIDIFREDFRKAEEERMICKNKTEEEIAHLRTEVETLRFSLDRKVIEIQKCKDGLLQVNSLVINQEMVQKSSEQRIYENMEVGQNESQRNITDCQRKITNVKEDLVVNLKNIWSDDKGIGFLKKDFVRIDRVQNELMEGLLFYIIFYNMVRLNHNFLIFI